MSEQTKYHLIFDTAEVRKYRPGQLIARVSKRSAICGDTYGKYYKESVNTIKEQFENQKNVEMADQTINKAFGQVKEPVSETVMSQYVVKLTKSSNDVVKLTKSSGSPAPEAKEKKRGNKDTLTTNQGRNQNSTIFNSGLTSTNLKPYTIEYTNEDTVESADEGDKKAAAQKIADDCVHKRKIQSFSKTL